MASVFDPLMVNKLEMPNRFVRSATMDGMADNGRVSDKETGLRKPDTSCNYCSSRPCADRSINPLQSSGLFVWKFT